MSVALILMGACLLLAIRATLSYHWALRALSDTSTRLRARIDRGERVSELEAWRAFNEVTVRQWTLTFDLTRWTYRRAFPEFA